MTDPHQRACPCGNDLPPISPVYCDDCADDLHTTYPDDGDAA